MRKKAKAKSPKTVLTRKPAEKRRRRRALKKTSTFDALAPTLGPTGPMEEIEGQELGSARESSPGTRTRRPRATALASAILQLVQEKSDRIKGPQAEKILKILLAL